MEPDHQNSLKRDLPWYVSLLAVIAVICPILAGMGAPQILWVGAMMAAGAALMFRAQRIILVHFGGWVLRMSMKGAEALRRALEK